jgi:HAD superfamily hydrolase (TIGR01509 family)
MIRALLWDVDGTLAETERHGHLSAFNLAFAEAGVPWRWSAERYGELLRVAGGRERLMFDMQGQDAAPRSAAARTALAAELHRLKSRHYETIVATGALPLRAGVRELLEDCRRAAVSLGVVTTTSRGNVAALLGRHLGSRWREQFAALVCAEDAPCKKPDPQAYQVALAQLALKGEEAVAVEDSPAGVAAAGGAGVAVVVTRSHYFPDTPAGAGVLACGASLAEPHGWSPAPTSGAVRVSLEEIERWRQSSGCPSPTAPQAS